LILSGSQVGSGGGKLSLTDDSQISSTVIFNDAGRVYQIVSGAAGAVSHRN
jgi:hypothetical protein